MTGPARTGVPPAQERAREAIRAQVLRAIAANRTPGYHFPGHLLDVHWPAIARARARLALPVAPHVLDVNGNVDFAALAVFADTALGTAARLRDAHHERQATIELSLQLTGVAPAGDITASAMSRDPTPTADDHYALTEARLEAGGRPVAYAFGTFTRLHPPRGVVLAPLPWQREQASVRHAVDEGELDGREREVLERCDAALARAGGGESFIRCLWGGELVNADAAPTRRLVMGPHATNRVGHVQGGVLVAFAVTNATDAVPARMRLSSVCAWFVGPGVTSLVARSTVAHAGRMTTLVRTDVGGSDGTPVLHAVTQHVASDG